MSIRITQLPPLSAITDATVFLVVDNFISKQVTGTALKTYLSSGSGGNNINVLIFNPNQIINLGLGIIQKLTLLGNVTSSSIASASNGAEYTFIIVQNNIGGFSFVWPSNFMGAGIIGSGFDSGMPNAVNLQKFVYDQIDGVFYATNSMETFVNSSNVSQDLSTENNQIIFTENSVDISS